MPSLLLHTRLGYRGNKTVLWNTLLAATVARLGYHQLEKKHCGELLTLAE